MEDLIKKQEGVADSSESEEEAEAETPETKEQTKDVQPEVQAKQPELPKAPLTLDEKIIHTIKQISNSSNVKDFKKNSAVRIYVKTRAVAELDIVEFKVPEAY